MMLANFIARLFGGSGSGGVENVASRLARLEKLGIGLRTGVDLKTLTDDIDPAFYRRQPWPALLIALGSGPILGLGPPSEWNSDDIWFNVVDEIVNPGDLAIFVERVGVLSHGRLSLSDVRDTVGEAGEDGDLLSFRCNGKDYRWLLNQDNPGDKYVDPELWLYFEDLFDDAGITDVRLFTCLMDNYVLVVVTTPERAKALSDLTGMSFV